jgi:hypothetical protein
VIGSPAADDPSSPQIGRVNSERSPSIDGASAVIAVDPTLDP